MRDAPVPIAAQWIPAFKNAVITFSHPIQDASPLDFRNWVIRFTGLSWLADSAAASGGVVTVHAPIPVPDPGPDIVTFLPPPFDVISDTVKPFPAPGFADFPLV